MDRFIQLELILVSVLINLGVTPWALSRGFHLAGKVLPYTHTAVRTSTSQPGLSSRIEVLYNSVLLGVVIRMSLTSMVSTSYVGG